MNDKKQIIDHLNKRHQARKRKLVLCRVFSLGSKPHIRSVTKSNDRKAWKLAHDRVYDIQIVARDGIILMQRKGL